MKINKLTKGCLAVAAALTMALSVSACSQKAAVFDESWGFDEIKNQAKGQAVSLYGWGGNEDLNKFLDDTLSPELKEEYGITLNRVPMDIDQVLAKLSGEKQAGVKSGAVDVIWINGENFYSAKENGLLYGPFTQKLPNYGLYIDPNTESSKQDFGYPIEGFEAPYSKAQMVLITDKAKTAETPKSAEALLDFAKKNPGKVTYPAPPDFTGSAFVRNLIYDTVGYEEFFTMEESKEAVKSHIEPALSYLRELNLYLWKQGKTFPSTIAALDNMYADGELLLTISYEPYSIALNIEKGLYPETSQSFIFDKGTIGNTNYLSVAANSPNKAGALLVIDKILDPAMQAAKYKEVRLLPATDYPLLDNGQKELFDSIDIGKGIVPLDELLEKQLPEIPAKFVPIIEQLWLEEVVGK